MHATYMRPFALQLFNFVPYVLSFFSYVDEASFNSKPTFLPFVALLDNYNNFIGTSDFLSSQEKAEVDHFYDLIKDTSIFTKLYNYLLCRGLYYNFDSNVSKTEKTTTS